MASFGKLVLTSEGLQAQALSQAGVGLKFSRIKMGDGNPTGNVASMNDLVRPKVALNITNGELKDNVYTVSAYFSNTELTEGFYWRELGVFIINASGKEVLYAYANAGSNYDYIPATEDEKFAKWIRVSTAVGNATDISIVEDAGILYVDTLTFEEYKDAAQRELYNGYKVVEENYYAGIAGDYGIEVGKIEGRSLQEGTPTPDTPVEIKSFGDGGVNFVSHGFQLFDASKLATKTSGEAKVTNNGDGSFTISGSGTMTTTFSMQYTLTHEEFVRLFKAGLLTIDCGIKTRPALFFQVTRVINGESTWVIDWNNAQEASGTFEITQEMLDDPTSTVRISIYAGTGNAVVAGTMKPMIYQDGNGTWESFRKPQSVSLAEPLRSLPNGVCDTYEDGNVTRRVGCIVLDGSEIWELNVNSYYHGFPDKKNRIDMQKGSVWCSHFKEIRKNASASGTAIGEIFEGFYKTGNKNIFLNYDNGVGGVDNFKAWLNENPVTVLYELETPVVEEASLTIPSWNPHTSVHHDSEVEPASIEWRILNGMQTDQYYTKEEVDNKHPVGSILITTTPEDPERKAGGRWLLLTSEGAYKSIGLGNGLVIENGENIASCIPKVRIQNNEINIHLEFKLAVDFNGTEVRVCKINALSIGLNGFGSSTDDDMKQINAKTSSGDKLVLCNTTREDNNKELVISIQNAISASGTNVIKAGELIICDIRLVPLGGWLNSHVGRFIWKRIS